MKEFGKIFSGHQFNKTSTLDITKYDHAKKSPIDLTTLDGWKELAGQNASISDDELLKLFKLFNKNWKGPPVEIYFSDSGTYIVPQEYRDDFKFKFLPLSL